MSTSNTAITPTRQKRLARSDAGRTINTLADVRASGRAALTISEVARVLEIDPRTVSSAAAGGDIPSVRLGRRVLVPRLAFLALFDAAGASE